MDILLKFSFAEEPEAPRNLRLVESGSRSVTLSWSAPYDGNAPIQNYLLTYKLAKGLVGMKFFLYLSIDTYTSNFMM